MMTLLIQTAAVPFGFAYNMNDFGADCSSRNPVDCAEMDYNFHGNEIDVSFPLPDVVTSNTPSLQPLRYDHSRTSFQSSHARFLSPPKSQDEVRNDLGNRNRHRTQNALHRCSSVPCGMEEPLASSRFRRYFCEDVNFRDPSRKSFSEGIFQLCERDKGDSFQCCTNEYVSQQHHSQSHNCEFISYETRMVNTYRGVGVDLLSIAEQFERNQSKARSKNKGLPPTTLKIPKNFAKYVLMSFACLMVWRLVNKYHS